MTRSGAATRDRILDNAERLVLDQGLAATSVDDILAAAGTSKGAFFHHFPTKGHLARALVERYVTADLAFLDEFMAQAENDHGDPGRQLLAFLQAFVDASDELARHQPSCLYVSYIYDRQLTADGTNDLIRTTFLAWRERLTEKLRQAAERHPPVRLLDVDALADHVVVTFEGAFVLARAIADPGVMRAQLALVRDLVALVLGLPSDAS
jgi:TetR/AcrR family transcriptional repressor of nem operon